MAELKLSDMLAEVVDKGASDLHLSVDMRPVMRIDGQMLQVGEDVLTLENFENILKDMIPDERKAEYETTKDLDFSIAFSDGTRSARFRVNCAHEKGKPFSVLRQIPVKIRTLKELTMPTQLSNVATKHRGLFLVTGPTGSGKTTTLAAIIQEINMTRACHLITAEDPIEFEFKSDKALIHQREVGADTNSFGEALRRALRQDPDVILIGEMRDLETIAAAITAAETGHLVMATLHTTDAAQTVDRIVDVFPPHQQQQIRMQLSNALIGICSQQLIPGAKGGRVCATEVLFATPAVRNCIREGKTPQIRSFLQTGQELGMHTLDQDLARLYREGKLTRDQVVSYAIDPKDIDRLLVGRP